MALKFPWNLVLTQMRVDDVPTLYDWYKLNPDALLKGKVFDIDWLYKVQADEAQWRYSVIVDGQLAGLATLWRNKKLRDTLSPTIIIGPEFRNHGIGTSVLTILLNIAHSIQGIEGVFAQVNNDNPSSLRMARKVFGEGFSDNGLTSFSMKLVAHA